MATAKLTAVPEYKHCKYDDIKKWCVENDKVEWLKTTKADLVKKAKEEGKKNPGYFALRKSFYLAFDPSQLPVGKSTIWNDIDAL